MTERKLKRPEVLAPAGTLEKLKTAIHYGADAVYIGGDAYGWKRGWLLRISMELRFM